MINNRDRDLNTINRIDHNLGVTLISILSTLRTVDVLRVPGIAIASVTRTETSLSFLLRAAKMRPLLSLRTRQIEVKLLFVILEASVSILANPKGEGSKKLDKLVKIHTRTVPV